MTHSGRRDTQKIVDMANKLNSQYGMLFTRKDLSQVPVAEKVYTGESVADGFYDSMTSLKNCDMELLRKDFYLADKFSNYDHIIKS